MKPLRYLLLPHFDILTDTDRPGSSGPGKLYLRRFYLIDLPWLGVYIHETYSSDPDNLHCHPWWNISIPLKHGYWEQRHDGTSTWVGRSKGGKKFVFRSPWELHRLRLAGWHDVKRDGPTISLFIRFKRVRPYWGFLETGAFREVRSRLRKDKK